MSFVCRLCLILFVWQLKFFIFCRICHLENSLLYKIFSDFVGRSTCSIHKHGSVLSKKNFSVLISVLIQKHVPQKTDLYKIETPQSQKPAHISQSVVYLNGLRWLNLVQNGLIIETKGWWFFDCGVKFDLEWDWGETLIKTVQNNCLFWTKEFDFVANYLFLSLLLRFGNKLR